VRCIFEMAREMALVCLVRLLGSDLGRKMAGIVVVCGF